MGNHEHRRAVAVAATPISFEVERPTAADQGIRLRERITK
jgi:hypothetical protein